MSNELRAAIRRAGGLASTSDLARRWGISAARAQQLAQHSTFPAPVATIAAGRTALYAIDEADAWRATPRRSGPPPGRRAAVTSALTPDGLAAELGITGRTLRHWLRGRYPGAAPGPGGHWELDADMVAAARRRWPQR